MSAACGRIPAPLVTGVRAAFRGKRCLSRGPAFAQRQPAGLPSTSAAFQRRFEHSEPGRRSSRVQAVKAEASPSQTYVPLPPEDLYPRPAATQQTLLRSFVITGIGLHSGAPETVRVRPAFAGEGRYFVHVADGTINPIQEVVVVDSDAERYEEMLLREFRKQLLDDEDVEILKKQEQEDAKASLAPGARRPQEAPAAAVAGEQRIPAAVGSLSDNLFLRTELKAGKASVRTVEHLLAALEACGVDNCRVEVQGSGELPVLDGSAAPWVEQLMMAGVGEAKSAKGGAPLPRLAPALSQQVTVTDGEAFISFTPDKRPRLSAGIDFTHLAPVIGRQWATWSPLDSEHFYETVGFARTFTVDVAHADLLKRGFCKGGSYDNALVASEKYYINGPERMQNEPAHHKLLDLLGDLSLLAEGGNAGLPVGHVVAYRAGHTLHAKFARALQKAIAESGGKMVPTVVYQPPPPPQMGKPAKVVFEGGKAQFEQDDML